jgi:hypothetical protein
MKIQDYDYHWVLLCTQHNGDSSAWTLQSIFMKDRQSKIALNPRKQFITDLIAFIYQKQSLNHEIILNLDANKALGEESQGITKLMRECNLVDLHNIPGMEPEQTPRHLPKRKQVTNQFHVWYTMDPNVCTTTRHIGIQ